MNLSHACVYLMEAGGAMRAWTTMRAVLVAVALIVAANNGAMAVASRGKTGAAEVAASVA